MIVFPIGGAHLEVKRPVVGPLRFKVSSPFAREGILGARVDGKGGSYQDCGREEGCQSAMHHKLTSEGDLQGDTRSLFIYGDDATGKMFQQVGLRARPNQDLQQSSGFYGFVT